MQTETATSVIGAFSDWSSARGPSPLNSNKSDIQLGLPLDFLTPASPFSSFDNASDLGQFHLDLFSASPLRS